MGEPMKITNVLLATALFAISSSALAGPNLLDTLLGDFLKDRDRQEVTTQGGGTPPSCELMGEKDNSDYCDSDER